MKNSRKEQGDNKPDLTGPCTVTVNGVEIEADVAAWVKTANRDSARLKTGDSYYSFVISEKFKKDVTPNESSGGGSDDLPF